MMHRTCLSNDLSVALYIAAAFLVGLGCGGVFGVCEMDGDGWLAASGVLLFVVGGVLDWLVGRAE